MRITFPLIAIVFICACFETGGGAATGSGGSQGVDIEGSGDVMDTPPLAGPGETDVRVAIPAPIINCSGVADYECLRLFISREPLCSFVEGQPVGWSEAEVKTEEAMSDGATVDLYIEKEGVAGNPSIAALGLTVTPGDVDAAKPGYQLPVEGDGTVKFTFKAGLASGIYHLKVKGQLGNVVYWAVGSLIVEDPCSALGEAIGEAMGDDGAIPGLVRVEAGADESDTAESAERHVYDPSTLQPVDEESDDETIRVYHLDTTTPMVLIEGMHTDEPEPGFSKKKPPPAPPRKKMR